MTPNLLCDKCIHNKICRLKDIIEPDMRFCPDQLLPETIGFISRANNLCLSDIIPYIKGDYFTIVLQRDEQDSPATYVYTYKNFNNYRVVAIDYDRDQQKSVITVEPIEGSK